MLKKRQLATSPIQNVIDAINSVHEQIRIDWSVSGGWAPDRAADLLGRSRLDWLCSLAESLPLWFRTEIRAEERDGNLILAWANLGALVEGSMKFLLSIWIVPYLDRVASPQESNEARFFRTICNRDKSTPREPDDLMLEQLRQFFDKAIWKDTPEKEWSAWVLKVARYRNAIHAYQDRDIATFEQFEVDVRMYWRFLTEFITCRLPEPPDRSIDV
jgi:hypothetical protein